MKIELKNLGAIEQAELDIKPLSIFVGPNSTGKTWTAYTLAAVLGSYGWRRYFRAYIDGKTDKNYPDLDEASERLLDQGNARINMVEFTQKYAEKYFSDVTNLARNWLGDFLDSEKADFGSLELCVRLDTTAPQFVERIQSWELDKKLSAGRETRKGLVNALKEAGEDYLHFVNTTTGENILDELPGRVIREFVARTTFEVLQRSLYPYVHFFPTERTTFITLSKIFAHPDRDDLESKIDDPDDLKRRFGRPMASIVSLISGAFHINQSARNKQAEETPAIQKYIELAKLLETDIFKGQIDFSHSQPGPQRELLFRHSPDIALEMQVSSSMVKELTPLLLCLRYFVEPHEWLIIDEPEMNLHPEAQAKMIEFLAMLVNAGLQVLITTHSPYVVDHLMNLIKAAENPQPEEIKDKFFLKRTDAFIDKDKVSVYLFNHGTAASIIDEEGQIDWDTFADISERTEKIFFEI